MVIYIYLNYPSENNFDEHFQTKCVYFYVLHSVYLIILMPMLKHNEGNSDTPCNDTSRENIVKNTHVIACVSVFVLL